MKHIVGSIALLSLLLACSSSGDNPSQTGGEDGEAGQGGANNGGAPAVTAGQPPTTESDAGEDSELGGAGGGGAAPDQSWRDCQDSDEAFVQRSYLATLGMRPRGQAEIKLYTDLIRASDGGEKPRPGELTSGRKRAVLAMIKANGTVYVRRWAEFYRDALRVERDQQKACFQSVRHPDPKALANMVKTHTARFRYDQPFTMMDLIRGAIELDDVTPMYLGNLFAFLNVTFPGANAEPVALELARRRSFGEAFSATYLNRDLVCLKCHNSESSTTFDPDPAKNRHFPVPALLEKALFGDSRGPRNEDGQTGSDRAFAPLRFDGFVASAGVNPDGEQFGVSPWNWDPACGTFVANPGEDVAQIDAQFGALRGKSTSPWELSESLQRGFAQLSAHGLTVGPGGEVQDPNEAFAYLTSLQITEQVWREVLGTPLTIATYYPRNAVSRDHLHRLTEDFVASGFSQVQLLLDIFASPLFNQLAPEAGCVGPYALPRAFDPWVLSEEQPEKRGNSLGDGVAPLAGRVAYGALHGAMGWRPRLLSEPDGLRQFEGDVGFFITNAQPGFKGFDFQARLAWEERYGVCAAPDRTGPDFIDELIEQGKRTPGASFADAVLALKDRLINEPSFRSKTEQSGIEELSGMKLDTPIIEDEQATMAALRRVCGALISTPQFLMSQLPPRDAASAPSLTPDSASYRALCSQVAQKSPIFGKAIRCVAGGLELSNGENEK